MKNKLVEETQEILGIPKKSCSRNFKRRFYHLGLSFLPKQMTREKARDLSSSKETFQQLRNGGLVCGTYGSGFVGDRTVLTLEEYTNSNGRAYYTPSTSNPMDF